jgi:predicted nucleic acid-binding protein
MPREGLGDTPDARLLIAVPAIRADASVLHNDRDFDAIARHTPLRVEPLSGS